MSQEATPADIIEFMLDPGSYAHDVKAVKHYQTHISHLFFAGDYVYKLKKPIDLGFLDFSTLAKRQAAAIAEIELNRRIAPDIYLDVATLHRNDQGVLSFKAPTVVEEVAVVMRRLPEDQRLSKLIETGAVKPKTMRDLGVRIAEFHERTESSPEIEVYGSLETVRHNWDENFEQTEPFIGRTITHETWTICHNEIERYMRSYTDLFARRIADGRIRDCHGDMQTDDIFIDPKTGAATILDAIEFNRRFRYSDTLSDLAFLSMDLSYRGAADLGMILLEAYYERSNDRPIPALLRFYECYRAYVRGKVRSFVIDQPGPSAEEKKAAADEARRFFELALSYAETLRPRLILVMGLIGSGKTKQADGLASRSGVRVLHSDIVRKELAGIDPNAKQSVPFGEGIYSAEWTDRTYGALLEEASAELAHGNSIVLDATWSKAWYRALARGVAAERDALFAIVECTASDEVLMRRLSRPGRSVTDGRLELLDEVRADYETPTDDDAERVIRIDTSGNFDSTAAALHEALFVESNRSRVP